MASLGVKEVYIESLTGSRSTGSATSLFSFSISLGSTGWSYCTASCYAWYALLETSCSFLCSRWIDCSL